MARAACLSDLGFALIPDFVVNEDIKAGRLVSLLEDWLHKDSVMFAVYPHRRYLPAKVRVFVDYLQRTTPESQYLVGDAHDADCAIVACSGAWLERCGYGEDEVIGRGCRHLQGPETCARAVAAMGEAMGRDGQCATSLINYHADGSKFQNDFILVPLTSRDGPAARYYMSVHAAEPALDWSLAPPVPARSPEARVRSFSDALPASPNAGSRVPV